MKPLSYCSRKASALALSEDHTRLLDTEAGIPWDSVLSNFRYDKAGLMPLEPTFSGSVPRDSAFGCDIATSLVFGKVNGFAAATSLPVRSITFDH